MITELEINNFKSIKHLKQPCTRVNIFIGEPNTGKSNILEAIGLFSYAQFAQYGELRDFIRYTRTTNLFYDEFIDKPFTIELGILSLVIKFRDGRFLGQATHSGNKSCTFSGDYNNLGIANTKSTLREQPLVKYYSFTALRTFPQPESEYLLPPHGANLVSLLLSNRDLRSTLNNIFNRYGLKLVLKPHDNLIEIIALPPVVAPLTELGSQVF